MPSSYSPSLVLLSYVVAVLASHVTLSLAQRLRPGEDTGQAARSCGPWIAGGAFAMGTGIWSMHFIGMLAFHLPIEVAYDVRLTAASYVIAVAVSGFALHIFRRNDSSLAGMALPAVLIGIGISAMHYCGMAALRMSPGIGYDPLIVATSVLIAIAASMAALWIEFSLPQGRERRAWHQLAAASVMGAAIVGMHYTGMAAASFAPGAICISSGPIIDATWLATAIGGFSTLILVATLMVSILDAHLAAREAAEEASRAKSQFLAGVSHEIRTPMNAILGLLELLSFSRLDAEQRETVRLLRDSAGSLLRLIDDILDFSKIEARRIELQTEPVRLRGMVEQVTQMFGGVASAKGLTLESRVDPALPEYVCADPLRLAQVLGNFLSNAVKFTERGTIRLEVRREADAQEPDLIRFEVTDSGIGMDGATIERLCEPFVQGDARTSRRYGGTGLGLAICKRLAQLMRGRLDIRSEPGRGTIVALVVPLAATSAASITPAAAGAGRGSTSPPQPVRAPSIEAAAAAGQLILVVDDHPTNRRLLVSQLAWLGCAAEAAASGEEALRLFDERCAAGTPHALVITDCQMPEMDGYELARRLRRRQTGSSSRAPILAFTANTLAEAAEECRASGMDDVLTKPIVLDELRAKLERWMPHARALPPARAARDEDASLAEEFCEAHEEDLELLRQALRSQQLEGVTRAAHRIKGAARMFGDEPLAAAAAQLEQLARAQESWESLESAAGAVRSTTEQLFARTGWTEGRRRA
jgi:diguanylate cyclase